jgi:hypothetical protein
MQQKLPLSLRADRTGHDFSSTPQSARRSARFIWSPARDWFLSIGILFWAHLDLVFSSSQDLAQVRAGNEPGLRYVLPRGDCSNLGFWSVSPVFDLAHRISLLLRSSPPVCVGHAHSFFSALSSGLPPPDLVLVQLAFSSCPCASELVDYYRLPPHLSLLQKLGLQCVILQCIFLSNSF